jgi:hypothetical protein
VEEMETMPLDLVNNSDDNHCSNDTNTNTTTNINETSHTQVTGGNSSPATAWVNVSNDRSKTSKGKDQQHAPSLTVLNRPFSSSNITAFDFWCEYKYGSNSKPSLESLELQHGSEWRSDALHKQLDGKRGTSLKAAWSLHKSVYHYMEFHIDSGKTKEESLEIIQEVFNRFKYQRSGKPKLRECKLEFLLLWGLIDK